MSEILIGELEKNWDRFLALHADPEIYGGNAAANVCGVGFTSPLEEWCYRTGKLAREDISRKPRVMFGKMIEPFLLEMAKEKLGGDIKMADAVYRDDAYPWMIATPDMFRVKEGQESVIEAKSYGSWAKSHFEEAGATDAAQVQLTWYQGILGIHHGFIVAMVGGNPDEIYTPDFNFDQQLYDQLREKVIAFRECVKNDTPPAPGPGDADAIRAICQHEKPEPLPLAEEHRNTIEAYIAAKDQLSEIASREKIAKSTMKELENQIRLLTKDNAWASCGERLIHLKKVIRKPYEVAGCEYFTMSIK